MGKRFDWNYFLVKFTSRKWWAMLAGFITPILVLLNVDNLTVEKVGALIISTGALIAFIFSEGKIDAARAKTPVTGGQEDEVETEKYIV